MLCCRPRKEEYELNKDGDNDKSKKKDGNDPTDNNKQVNSGKEAVQEGLYEVVEPPVQIKVTEHLESENKLELSCVPDRNQTDSGAKGNHSQDSPVGKGGNPQFASQMSFTSQSSLREDIYRSREKFFTSSHPFDESLSQGDRKSVSSTTDERFAFHQSKIRSQHLTSALHRITVEEEEMAEKIHAAVDRLEQVAQRLELLASNSPKPAAGGAGGSAVSEADSAAVKGFDNLLSGDFASFLELSNKLGGDVQTMGVMVKDAFQKLRDCVVMAAKSKKPAPADMAVVFKPMSEQITITQNFREQNRKSKQFNHISGIAESISALGWVAVEPAPVSYVKEMLDAGMFYFNRVLKDTKGTDGGEDHGEWIKRWKGTLQGMADYIKEYHTTGLLWNPQGGDAKSAAAQSAGGAPPPPPPGGAPPPPPPPPPVDDSAPSSGGQAGSGGDAARAELFAALNKGSEITSGLKKVTDDMKTHKNPALRVQAPAPPGVRAGPAPFKAASSAPKPAPKPTAPVAKTPVFELQGKKWLVEHQIGNKNLVISDANLKQVVYIYKCTDSLVQVKGKVNSITVDSCKKLAVVVDDLVSSVEFVNSQSVQAQVTGKCPTVSIDKTDGCMVYLSKDSLDAEIVTAKSSEMNILVPSPKEDGDYVEFALPEQFKTTWNGSKFVTDCTESV